MPIAAVPKYMQDNDPEFYLAAPPGHRFLLYFPAWGENRETRKLDWRMDDRVPKIDKKTKQQKVGKSGPEWEDLTNGQFACTIAACKTPPYDEERPRARKPKADPGLKSWMPVMEALLARQIAAASRIAHDAVHRVSAQAISPFTTGLGNEHPLENGFAFLNPYGLPYLPGSGVKGVLRQAAGELANGMWADKRGWSDEKPYAIEIGEQTVSLSMLDVLFGLESKDGDTAHVRGALSFWDMIPQIVADSLMVEIMTPHQSHYYQIDKKKNPQPPHFQSPHDSGQPTPLSFLTVPPKSRFVFHVMCDLACLKRLAPDLAENDRWKTLLQSAFEHAFAWLGFGAKTAVGYGAMIRADESASQTGERQVSPAPRSRWVDDKLRELCSKPGIKEDDALRGKTLAEAVKAIDDETTRREALADIVHRWKEKGWWASKVSGSAKQAKAIYEELLGKGPAAQGVD
ncbi:Type III-B CRISPR module RAMP protein Cmr6 [Nitrospira tepida]|uniref:Type III-B CRISPR module RAMP protein Cmr6 n=1 Tax=Nitrospira tepida TaxID=2973512 RepID=A0AA86MW06_9BACT|nr:type III-B CRISPR module RAMP protein Cmr6 [Nitrospira tepida]CAI4030048.1 Type III-B CRISPR module RAMP protein Cmr6 [Nitrospira tepida]